MSDQQLLRDYAGKRSEEAFAELVRRHVDLVYSAAMRMVRDAHLAEDVTQGTFLALAQSAPQLSDRPVLSGWLHRTAQNLAVKAVRTDVRRRAREQEAAAMNELLSAEPNATWEQVAPHLDAALGELNEADRDALLLRYFERKSAREMARTLGISDEAAQKRVTRAVERLREFFAKRGVTVGASGLVVLISANGILTAPAGLSTAIAATALAGTTIFTAATATVGKAIAMTTLQKSLIAATLVAAVGTGIYEAHQTSTQRNQIQTLQQQHAAQVAQLNGEREDALRQLAKLNTEEESLKRNISELLRLRSEVGLLRRENQELAKSQAQQVGAPASLAPSTIRTDSLQNFGMGTPEKSFLTFLWAGRSGDSNLVSQMLRWRKDDTIAVEMADRIAQAQVPSVFQTFSNLAGIRILGQRSESPQDTRLRVEFSLDNGNTQVGEIYMVRDVEEWKPALNITAARPGSRTISAQFLLPTTPELGPTNQSADRSHPAGAPRDSVQSQRIGIVPP